MRLDKFLAHAELGSRKEVKAMIRKKRVRVNDQIIVKDDYVIDENNDVVYVGTGFIRCYRFARS